MVSILVSQPTLASHQRVGGAIVGFERKNQVLSRPDSPVAISDICSLCIKALVAFNSLFCGGLKSKKKLTTLILATYC